MKTAYFYDNAIKQVRQLIYNKIVVAELSKKDIELYRLTEENIPINNLWVSIWKNDSSFSIELDDD
ncbi:MAG: hypothetical protein EOM23_02025 [Candidatus Moranbacteria bacterium]|nr:hypothetical protein [Candidatus Moranbacteria bacterium]